MSDIPLYKAGREAPTPRTARGYFVAIFPGGHVLVGVVGTIAGVSYFYPHAWVNDDRFTKKLQGGALDATPLSLPWSPGDQIPFGGDMIRLNTTKET